jgi:hypothetical protein
MLKFSAVGTTLAATPPVLKRVRIKKVRDQVHIIEEAATWTHFDDNTTGGDATWFSSIPEQYQWILQKHQCPDSFHHIIQGITACTAKAVCDGSVKNGRGSAAAIITDTFGTGDLQLQFSLPYSDEPCSSFKAELYGIYATVLCVDALTKAYNVTHGRITIGCDNTGAAAESDWTGPISADQPEFNIIQAIRSIQRTSPIRYKFIHVKGHQDDHPGAILDDWAAMNVLMDTKAKEQWNHQPGSATDIVGAPWQIKVNGQQITNKLTPTLRESCNSVDAQAYWRRKNESQFKYTDLNINKATMLALPSHRRRWLTKHVAGICGVKTCLLRWRQSEDDTCPRCNTPETTKHVWSCQGKNSNEIWDKALFQLRTDLQEIQTNPVLLNTIIQHLNGWRYNFIPSSTNNDAINTATLHQQDLGWEALLEGRVAFSWSLEQQNYLQALGSRRSARRWLIALATKATNVAWDLWDHRNSIEHDTKKTETKQHIYHEVQRLLQLDWSCNKRAARMAKSLDTLTKVELKQRPHDYLLRWTQRMYIFEAEQKK